MTYFFKLLNRLNNLTVAITILLAIALTSALGTIIEQNKTIDFYLNTYPMDKPVFNFLNSQLILTLGLNHVYTSWWFILLIISLMISLTLCTITRQLPNLKLARLWQFYTNSNTKSKFDVRLETKNFSLSSLTYYLEEQNYKIKHLNNFVYGYKGITGKISPIVVHFSLVLILIGSFLGAVQGQTEEVFINVQNERLILNTCKTYVNDFKIAYNSQGLIDQFYSELTLETQVGSKIQKTIYVNEPLNYDGITIYQTDWNVNNIIISVGTGNYYTVPLQFIELQNGTGSKYWISRLNVFDQNLFCVINDLSGNLYLYDQNKDLVAVTHLGELINLNGHEIVFNMIVASTGLQIKIDHFIPFVYAGFFLLMLSTLTSYLSYSQVWLIQKDKIIYIFGNTNRASFTFKKHLIQLIK